jgi:hypothetical protein
MQDIKELGFILLIIVAVIAGAQWFLLRFTHWSVAMIATGFIALFISGIYVSLKFARPNGGSSGPDSSEFITPALIVFASLLLGLWLVSYLSKNQIPKIVFIVSACLIIVFAIGRNVYEYVHGMSFYFKNFSDCEIELLDKTGGKSNVSEISFQNSSSGFTSDIHPDWKEKPYPQIIRFADTITFRYYSNQTQKDHLQKFSFDYNLCKEKAGPIEYVFWLRSHYTLPMKVILLPDNKVDLYLGGSLVKQYQLKETNSSVINQSN